MTVTTLTPLANHLWQSTIFACIAWLLTLALRKNRAAVRYWIWFATSVKFLIPLSLLISAGGYLPWRTAPTLVQPQVSLAMERISQPFPVSANATLSPVAPAPATPVPAILAGIWLGGMAIGVVFWVRRFWRLRSVIQAATPLDLDLPIRTFSSQERLEPGVAGIFRPVLLLPEGIWDRLTSEQLAAIVAHELRHVARHDNITASIHMLVETIFWFHPATWWIRQHLIEERERACDQEVLEMGSEPLAYAEGILRVCEHYLASSAPCAAGVAGGKITRRIEMIMANRFVSNLTIWKKLALCAAAAVAIAFPLAVGAVHPEQASELQFEVVSIRPAEFPNDAFAAGVRFSRESNPCNGPLPAISGTLVTLEKVGICDMIRIAYGVKGYQVIGVPTTLGFSGQDRVAPTSYKTAIAAEAKQPIFFYDIRARAPGQNPPSTEQVREMLRSLLRDRFHLALHRGNKEISFYALVAAKDGPRLTPAADGCKAAPSLSEVMRVCDQTMEQVAQYLNSYTDRIVLDMTGIATRFDYEIPIDHSNMSNFRESLLVGFQERLKLKLEPRKSPVEVLIVDHVERPSEN
jgi:bla regulator protein blaR1